jgi:N utilization substance protein A
LVQSFKEQLDVDEEVAAILVQAGFSSVEEVAYVPAAELASIEEFDEDIVKELRNRARDVLLTQAIATEEKTGEGEPAEDLLEVDGMDDELAATLASRGIVTREDLAEQAIDDLTEIEGIDAARAGLLIMAARKHWFEASGAAKK